MSLEFLTRSEVREVLFELMWGDRFERDLRTRTSSDEEFSEIKERLLKEEIVYQFRGENDAPFLSLTDKGVAIINRLYEIERILEGEDIDAD
ncbi:MAG: hypothetical protein AM326_04060 [Candidatus Thorarchaeota archaeon SMTZ-45]|nr:MAG: hypothetical protein AM326_04060 [Candidatus Thorarchaeota archaeon SMTZ-45]KXH72170.1 MAG: hypothetical protein AM325_09415 [Candidatus Thorarchaeota archaeon SMTZ1-45]